MKSAVEEKKEIIKTYQRTLDIILEKSSSVVGPIRASDFLKAARAAAQDKISFTLPGRRGFLRDIFQEKWFVWMRFLQGSFAWPTSY